MWPYCIDYTTNVCTSVICEGSYSSVHTHFSRFHESIGFRHLCRRPHTRLTRHGGRRGLPGRPHVITCTHSPCDCACCCAAVKKIVWFGVAAAVHEACRQYQHFFSRNFSRKNDTRQSRSRGRAAERRDARGRAPADGRTPSRGLGLDMRRDGSR